MTDQRLEKALEFANYRSTLANQKEKLKDRCEAQLNMPTMVAYFISMKH